MRIWSILLVTAYIAKLINNLTQNKVASYIYTGAWVFFLSDHPILVQLLYLSQAKLECVESVTFERNKPFVFMADTEC